MSANLVVNGDFETGDFTGWTVVNPDESFHFGTAFKHSGTYALYLSGNSFGSIAQPIPTIVGATYTIDFWMAGNVSDVEMEALFGGVRIYNTLGADPDWEWRHVILTHVATSTSSELKFNFTTGEGQELDLDDVSVTLKSKPVQPPRALQPEAPCRGCGAPVDCPDDDPFSYTLTADPIYPFVFFCPSSFCFPWQVDPAVILSGTGSHSGGGTGPGPSSGGGGGTPVVYVDGSLTLHCGNRVTTRRVPAGTTQAQLNNLIASMLTTCPTAGVITVIPPGQIFDPVWGGVIIMDCGGVITREPYSTGIAFEQLYAQIQSFGRTCSVGSPVITIDPGEPAGTIVQTLIGETVVSTYPDGTRQSQIDKIITQTVEKLNGGGLTWRDTVSLDCCSHILSREVTSSITNGLMVSIAGGMLAECQQYQAECIDPPTCPACDPKNPLVPKKIFYSAGDSCTVFCPDGAPFTYYVRPGRFIATSQASANRSAHNYACQQAPLHRLCLSPLEGPCTVDATVALLITATGHYVDTTGTTNFWSLLDGSVPTGLTLHTGFGGPTLSLDGTPTVPGTYTFTVKIRLKNGDYATRQYILQIMANLIINVADSVILVPPDKIGAGRVLSGHLPAGMTLAQDINGNDILTGTPTALGTCTFTITYP